MAISISSATLFPASSSSKLSSRTILPSALLSIAPSSSSCAQRKSQVFRSSRSSLTKVFVAPETLEETEDDFSPEAYSIEDEGGISTPALSVAADSDKIAPKQKIRIKLRSYWVPLIEDSCKQILDAARTTNAKTMGPVPLPTKKRVYCVLKSPHVNKDARFHFEIRTHQRLIDILYPTAQTIDSLMQLDLPAGVDVEVKL